MVKPQFRLTLVASISVRNPYLSRLDWISTLVFSGRPLRNLAANQVWLSVVSLAIWLLMDAVSEMFVNVPVVVAAIEVILLIVVSNALGTRFRRGRDEWKRMFHT